jgi:hypothetical protein
MELGPQKDNVENILELHKKGHMAIHAISSPHLMTLLEKIDDRRILNNLREDGGTEMRARSDYQLYTQISATILPPAQYPVGQNLYLSGGRILIGLNMEKSVIQEFSVGDAGTDYKFINKSGRQTYRAPGADIRFTSTDSAQTRLEKMDGYNNKTAFAMTQPTGDEDDLFGVEPPMLYRPMNEIVLKINDQSMCSLSMETSDLKHPDALLNLIYVQQLYKLHTGREYPIFLLNNSKQAITTDLPDGTLCKIEPNQFYQINPILALKEIANKHPLLTLPKIPQRAFISNEIYDRAMIHDTQIQFRTADFFEMIGFDPATNIITGLPNKDVFDKNALIEEVNKACSQLAVTLPSFNSDDSIIQTHKPKRSADEQYEEINQTNLNKFIRSKVLGLKEGDPILPAQMDQYKGLIKAYNLQFRLNVYSQLLSSNAPANYQNLDRDLKWLSKLNEKLDKTPSTSPKDKPSSYSTAILSSYRNLVDTQNENKKENIKITDDPKNTGGYKKGPG